VPPCDEWPTAGSARRAGTATATSGRHRRSPGRGAVIVSAHGPEAASIQRASRLCRWKAHAAALLLRMSRGPWSRERDLRHLYIRGATPEQAAVRCTYFTGTRARRSSGCATERSLSPRRHRHHSLTNSCEQCPAAGLWRPTLNPPSVGRSFHPDAHEATGRRFSLELDLSGTRSLRLR